MSRNTAKSWCRKSQAFPGITCAHCLLCQRKLLELTLKEVRRKVPGLTQYLPTSQAWHRQVCGRLSFSFPFPTPQFKSIQFSAVTFFIVHLSYPSMTYGKTIALTGWIFVGKATSRLFNMLSSLVITFLPSHKYVLSSWRQTSPAVISKPPKIVCCCFQCFPIYFP